LVRFSLDRRWATLAVAVLLGAGGGSLLGFVTAPGDGAVERPAPAEQVATTTRRPRGDFAGVSSTTRWRPGPLPAATAGLRPATTATTAQTARPTTTTAPASTTTRPAPTTTTTTTTTGDGTTTSSSSTVASSTTSTT
jgi:hypothetical protein